MIASSCCYCLLLGYAPAGVRSKYGPSTVLFVFFATVRELTCARRYSSLLTLPWFPSVGQLMMSLRDALVAPMSSIKSSGPAFLCLLAVGRKGKEFRSAKSCFAVTMLIEARDALRVLHIDRCSGWHGPRQRCRWRMSRAEIRRSMVDKRSTVTVRLHSVKKVVAAAFTLNILELPYDLWQEGRRLPGQRARLAAALCVPIP
jgi:hypothetical protein